MVSVVVPTASRVGGGWHSWGRCGQAPASQCGCGSAPCREGHRGGRTEGAPRCEPEAQPRGRVSRMPPGRWVVAAVPGAAGRPARPTGSRTQPTPSFTGSPRTSRLRRGGAMIDAGVAVLVEEQEPVGTRRCGYLRSTRRAVRVCGSGDVGGDVSVAADRCEGSSIGDGSAPTWAMRSAWNDDSRPHPVGVRGGKINGQSAWARLSPGYSRAGVRWRRQASCTRVRGECR